jgi:membrane-associated phospholipid phosphatase
MDSTFTYRGVTFYNSKTLLFTTVISVVYLLLSYWLIGFKTDQLVLVGIFNSFYYLTWGTRKFIQGFSIFIIFWVLFDFMKAFPNYQYNQVHIQSLYEAEKGIFGIWNEGKLLTPNEFWLAHKTKGLDILSGVFYLSWVPVPLVFAGFLYFKNRVQFFHFSLTFLLVNLIGFVIYYVYPAAPPWYVQLHGFEFYPHTPGNTAGLARFDAYFNVQVFQSLYAKSSNVFAAMPSLHSAYPLLVLVYGWRNSMGWLNILFALIVLGIWFAAVYTSHHYILDVMAGILCATTGILVYNKLLKQRVEQLIQ